MEGDGGGGRYPRSGSQLGAFINYSYCIVSGSSCTNVVTDVCVVGFSPNLVTVHRLKVDRWCVLASIVLIAFVNKDTSHVFVTGPEVVKVSVRWELQN